jgi:2-(1,2-epoxy-1,2-dihydrophenyl)acetyl-CoA isomerase
MSNEPVIIEEQQGSLRILRLNRPERLNAINGEMMDEILASTQRAADDDEVRAVVLTGAGKAFCAGGDVRDGARPKQRPDTGDKPRDKRQERIDSQFERTEASLLLHTMPKPTIALVRGAAMGAGMSLALACDFRIISKTAVFRTAFVNNALSGDYGIAYFLAKALGTPKAMELLMLSEKLDAGRIDRLGLATLVVDDAQLESEGLAFAETLANGPTIAYAGIKRNVVGAATMELLPYLALESANQVSCSFSDDIREAARAFKEKRPPVYQGR